MMNSANNAMHTGSGYEWGVLRANSPARRVVEQPLPLAGLHEMPRLLTSSCPSNKWAAKDAEVTLVGNADSEGSAPLTPDRYSDHKL